MALNRAKVLGTYYLRGLRWLLGPGFWGRELSQARENTVLVAGSGRSGTTWISDLLNAAHAYRSIFEPFDPDRAGSNWVTRHPSPYRRPGEGDPELRRRCRRLFQGKFRAKRCDVDNKAWLAHGRLIKAIRANLLLGWLREEFPPLRICLILRHPFDVALSQERYGTAFPNDVETDLLSQPDLRQDWIDPYADMLLGLRGTIAKRTAYWCVQSLVPLSQLSGEEAFVLYYEHVRQCPEEVVPRAQQFLGLPVSSELEELVEKPSRTSRLDPTEPRKPRDRNRQGMQKWSETIDPQDLQESADVLRAFGMDRMYTDDGRPACSSGHEPLAAFPAG